MPAGTEGLPAGVQTAPVVDALRQGGSRLRKRTDREMADNRKFAVSNLLESLLSVMDSLKIGLSTVGSEADADGL